MDLATAIREGATKRPQVGGALFRALPDGRLGSCAIGAAYEALTGATLSDYRLGTDEAVLQEHVRAGEALRAAFPALIETTRCPVTGCESPAASDGWSVSSVVTHLNDASHRWTREQIADWLDTR